MNPEEILADARIRLEQDGIEIRRSHLDPAGAVLLAEAVNWAAKAVDEEYYLLKPEVVWAAAAIGADSCWVDGVYHLWAPGLTAPRGFHDPYGQFDWDESELPEPVAEFDWGSYEWDGISRQHLSWSLLSRPRGAGHSDWFRNIW